MRTEDLALELIIEPWRWGNIFLTKTELSEGTASDSNCGKALRIYVIMIIKTTLFYEHYFFLRLINTITCLLLSTTFQKQILLLSAFSQQEILGTERLSNWAKMNQLKTVQQRFKHRHCAFKAWAFSSHTICLYPRWCFNCIVWLLSYVTVWKRVN